MSFAIAETPRYAALTGTGTLTRTDDSNGRTVIVQRGDTLGAIAAREGVSLQALIDANPQILNPDHLYPGDTVVIPSETSGGPESVSSGSEQAASQRSISQNGVDLIKGFEGLRTTAYQDSAGVWTIGYGHTGPDVHPGQHISEAQAQALLRQDVARFEAAVRKEVKVPLTQGQFDALVSFTYNLGEGTLRNSTLLKKLNAGDYAGAQAEFGKFVHAGGQVLPGLVSRREKEAALFGGAAPSGSDSLGRVSVPEFMSKERA